MARVEGFEPAQSGQEPVDSGGNPIAVGVWGDSSTGVGVFGTSGVLPSGVDNPPVNIAGVEGHSIQNAGVFGFSVEDTGVWGESSQGLGMLGRSSTGSGVLGVTFAPTVPGEPPNAAGVFGSSVAGGNGVTGFVGSATGVVGNSVRGIGVSGLSGDDDGVSGFSLGANGVRGVGGTDRSAGGEIASGVFGSSPTGFGVRGMGTSNSGIAAVAYGRGDGASGLHFSTEAGSGVSGTSVLSIGVNGFSFSGLGIRGEGRNGGVHGISTSTAANAGGIIGENPSGFAGVFLGKVRVTGLLSKSGGGFEIDHPLDPANQYLRHSFVECPEMLNVYSGNVTTDDAGEASVALPDYFEALNHDFRYQLTVVGQFAQAIVSEEIRHNQFTIKTDQPRIKVSWQVTGTRQDPWAAANPIAVEEAKAAEEKGRYLHPELYARPEEAIIHRSPQHENQLRRTREDQLQRAAQLVPEQLRQRLERSLQGVLRGDHVDTEEMASLLAEARQLAERHAMGEPPRIDRTRLEEQWRRVEELVQASDQTTSLKERDQARLQALQVSELVPEQLRQPVEQHLQALRRGDRLNRQVLQSLVAEARQLAERPPKEEPPRIDRAHLEEAWRQVEALVQRRR
jgi:hypothetical protein